MTTPIAMPFNALQFWTGAVSDFASFLAKLSGDIQWFQMEQANGLIKIGDRETAEMARLGLDMDFDADDISNADYAMVMKKMKQTQDVQNRYQAERDQFMLKCKRKEDFLMQEQEKLQLKYENAQAQKETWKEVCQNIDCSYFGE